MMMTRYQPMATCADLSVAFLGFVLLKASYLLLKCSQEHFYCTLPWPALCS